MTVCVTPGLLGSFGERLYLFDRCHFTHSQVDQDLFLTLQQTLFSTLQVLGFQHLAHVNLLNAQDPAGGQAASRVLCVLASQGFQ